MVRGHKFVLRPPLVPQLYKRWPAREIGIRKINFAYYGRSPLTEMSWEGDAGGPGGPGGPSLIVTIPG